MLGALVAGVVGFAAVVLLHGCGGGGGPAPSPTPAPAPIPTPGTLFPISVLSFNLQWHALGNDTTDIDKTITANGPFDIMGLQGCEDAPRTVEALTKTNASPRWNTMQLWSDCDKWPKCGPHDIAIAWDKTKFNNVSQGFAETGEDANVSQGFAETGENASWTRVMQWVRLEIIGTNDVIFFANVHGAVNKCNDTGGEEVLGKYTNAIDSNKKKGDHVFFTGDFNCQTYDDVIQGLGGLYNDSARASFFYPSLYQPDHIFTSKSTKTVGSTGVCCSQPGKDCTTDNGDRHCVAYPSDHELLKGNYVITLGGAEGDTVIIV